MSNDNLQKDNLPNDNLSNENLINDSVPNFHFTNVNLPNAILLIDNLTILQSAKSLNSKPSQFLQTDKDYITHDPCSP